MFPSAMASAWLSDSESSIASRIQSRSAPAEKVPSAPVTNTTRTPSAPARVSNAWCKAPITSSSKAFFLPGRVIVTVATPDASASIRTWVD